MYLIADKKPLGSCVKGESNPLSGSVSCYHYTINAINAVLVHIGTLK